MKRLWSTIMVLFAVFALTAPTLAAGYVSMRAQPLSQTGQTVSPILSTVLKPCQVQGGKRVLPCQSHQGILAQLSQAMALALGTPRAFYNDRLPEGLPVEPTLPPPRLLS